MCSPSGLLPLISTHLCVCVPDADPASLNGSFDLNSSNSSKVKLLLPSVRIQSASVPNHQWAMGAVPQQEVMVIFLLMFFFFSLFLLQDRNGNQLMENSQKEVKKKKHLYSVFLFSLDDITRINM